MTSDQPVAQTPSQPLEPEAHTCSRAPYTPPTLETHGAFLVVTGCSLGAGCLPINDLGANENQGG
jgi:hypothetical protein